MILKLYYSSDNSSGSIGRWMASSSYHHSGHGDDAYAYHKSCPSYERMLLCLAVKTWSLVSCDHAGVSHWGLDGYSIHVCPCMVHRWNDDDGHKPWRPQQWRPQTTMAPKEVHDGHMEDYDGYKHDGTKQEAKLSLG